MELYNFTLKTIRQGYFVTPPKAKDLSVEQRGQQRQQFSKPVLAKIEGLLIQHLHGVTPGSLLGKALHYLSSQWPKLNRFVRERRLAYWCRDAARWP